ncbi:TPA: replication initiator protein A [Streptococcus pneumoniae]|uniref:replication initiator protein A n=1 Tax=Streptococcus pneumoniae TaxID=1313 RepID=UPI0005E5A62F|nr:replication initiator protein A [Streptococcus pneumoniae]MDG7110467.1 replication initiator protein A [Streptococcus pneumoniae]MDG7389961.1 replication initiator protein A [Streptococcus pneumoniae]MDH7770963.1 replication initiator protein A [Streptococcus pneumoniae]CAG6271450.1 putative replication initiation protein Rep [Streptococcus pneumoniae]CJD52852.1 putative replication initiation protein Rep [Streptococcus pneumoniae]
MADITIDQLATQTFYQIPEIFFTRIQHNENGYVKLTSSYTGLSSDAKLAYGALYNRCKLSISSFQKGNRDYVDENGAVFLIFTVSDLMLLLDKGKMKVTKIKKELQEHGLLREVRQGLNKPNRLYLQLVDANLEIVEHYSIDGELLKRIDAFGKVLYEKECDIEKTPKPLGNSGSPQNGRPQNGLQNVHKTDGINTERSQTESSYDTNRYEGESSLSGLSISEAFKMGQHGFLSPQLVQKLSMFGKDAKILENKIYQSKRQVEKNYNNLLAGQEIYGEVWLQDLERELDKLIFKIKTGEAEEKPIQNVPAYFYKMMIRFWKMALLIEKEHGFLELSGQSEYARKFPEECPSVIAHYYPDKLSEIKLNHFLDELSKDTVTC